MNPGDRPLAQPGQAAQQGTDPGQAAQPGDGWRGAHRELAVAGGLVLSVAAAAWAVEGPGAASLVVLVSVAASLVLLRTLIVPGGQSSHPAEGHMGWQADKVGLEQIRLTHSFAGFWRTQGDLTSATQSLTAWDYGSRPRLANLLAARLAERHGVSMAHDPEAARRLLNGSDGRDDLWFWIDPERPSPPDATAQPGIPPKVLAALIERLEQL